MRVKFAVFLLFSAASCAISGACTSSQTSLTTAPTASDKCQFSVTNTTSAFSASGGTGTVNVATARDCTWSIAADAGWVSITGGVTGQGESAVAYSVAPNPAPVTRSAAISVASQRLTLSQAAAPCQYSLSRTADSIGANGGRLTVSVTTLNGCAWSAAATVGWIAVSSGQSGNANGTVELSVGPNTATAARTGQVTIAGQAYTVTQSAASSPTPDPTPNPPPPPPPPPTGQQVHIEGIAFVVGGKCPNITFVIGLQRIITNRDTDYEGKPDCADLRTGRTVAVDGTQTDEFVVATKIQINKDEDDE
jgi:hypothetical protein